MKTFRCVLLALACGWLAFGGVARAEDTLANGYSAAPLAAPIFTPEQVATEVARLNNWLIENHQTLAPDRRQAVREGLYTLLASYVSHRRAEEKPLLPEEDDLIMRTIFSWAEPLGVYGAHLVFNELLDRRQADEIPRMPALAPLPSAFSMAYEEEALRLSSARGGWSVSIPFWFMPFAISEFDTREGMRTQLAMIATGATTHEGIPGQSQSTIRLFVGPGQVGGEFARYWREVLGFPRNATREAFPIEGLNTTKTFDEAAQIHSEMVSWMGNTGPIAVYYAGAPGPYEANRVHFIDFVRSLRAEP